MAHAHSRTTGQARKRPSGGKPQPQNGGGKSNGKAGGQPTTRTAAPPRSTAPGQTAPSTGQRPASGLSPQARAQLATRAAPRPVARPTARPVAASSNRRAWNARIRGLRSLLSGNSWVLGLTLIALLAIAIFAVVRGNGSASGATPGQLNSSNVPLTAGKPAPNFTLSAEQGGNISLSQYRGHVVLLEFFAPWCPHCRAETSTLEQIASTDAVQGVQVLSVTATPYGYNYESNGDTSPITMNDVKQFVDNYHVNYPALLDTSLRAGNAYGVVAYPQMYVIDRNGNVTWNNGLTGETAYTTLQAQIQKALLVPLATAAPSPTVTPVPSPTR